MVKLSERLYSMASAVGKGEKLADIGTDHGYIPIYLAQNRISPYIILSDISKGSLEKARYNCKKYGLSARYPHKIEDSYLELREGDGLEVLKHGEVDTVILAGMGGKLIKEIIDWDLKKTLSFNKLIVQPRNNFGLPVKWLKSQAYSIVGLDLVPEGDRLVEIITAIKPDKRDMENDNSFFVKKAKKINQDEKGIDMPFYEYPDELFVSKSPYLMKYLRSKLWHETRIKEQILKNTGCDPSPQAQNAIAYRDIAIKRISSMIRKIERGTNYEN
jgi:tRNA (adenine22-N1)-methyltransferase